MILFRILPLLLIFLLLPLAPTSVAFAKSYAEIRSDYQRLIKSAQLQRQRRNWEKQIAAFERFIQQNPNDENLDKALFLKAKTWDGLSRASGSRKDARQAIESFLQMVERFPGNRLADDALFLAGQAAEQRLHDPAQAYGYYQRLVEQMPQADMVPDARQRLAVLPQPKVVPAVPQPVAQPAPPSLSQAIPSGPAHLIQIRHWSGPEHTRVVLDMTAPVSTKPKLLKGNNPRVYFDLPNTLVGAKVPQSLPIHNGVVQRVRTSQFDKTKARIVLDLYQPREYQLNTLEDPFRIVLDIKGSAARVDQSQTPVISAQPAPSDDSIASILDSVPADEPILHVPQQSKESGLRLIVIDAGHGGKDPGAVGPDSVLEKDITLGMAKLLAKKLQQDLGVQVKLTRSSDKFLELRERTAYANQVGADLFISLHANASPSRNAYGIETYFLNLSKNNQAAEVAARENGTSLEDVSNLEAILFDLMANAKINESSRLAAEVQKSLVVGLRPHYSKIKDLGVRQGPFHVLLGATMPSVLVEAAFISNKREAKRLQSRAYQERVAAAIVKGVKNYAATIDQVALR